MDIDSQEFRALYPFAHRYYPLPCGRMHYIDEGAGRNVLLLHGNPSWSFLYRNLAKDLRKGFRVLAPDHIGMGLSDKPQDYSYTLAEHIGNLEQLLEEILPAPQKVSLVMHDWGGAIGMGWAVRHPERVEKLVVMNTAAFLSSRIPLRINVCRIPGFGALAIRGCNAFAGAAVHMAVRKPLAAAVAAGFLLPYDNWANRVATLRFVQDIPLSPAHRSYEALAEIDIRLELLRGKPLLVQWGGRDWCFNDSFYDEWLRRFPEAEYDYYGEAGHYLLEDAGEKIIPRIAGFLAAESAAPAFTPRCNASH